MEEYFEIELSHGHPIYKNIQINEKNKEVTYCNISTKVVSKRLIWMLKSMHKEIQILKEVKRMLLEKIKEHQ